MTSRQLRNAPKAAGLARKVAERSLGEAIWCRIMMCISMGSSSNDKANCEVARADILEAESCSVAAGCDAFDIVGCDSATGGGKRSLHFRCWKKLW